MLVPDIMHLVLDMTRANYVQRYILLGLLGTLCPLIWLSPCFSSLVTYILGVSADLSCCLYWSSMNISRCFFTIRKSCILCLLVSKPTVLCARTADKNVCSLIEDGSGTWESNCFGECCCAGERAEGMSRSVREEKVFNLYELFKVIFTAGYVEVYQSEMTRS